MSIQRDYKPASVRQRRRTARRHALLVITLILIGLFGGLLAYIRGGRLQQNPAASTAAAPPAPTQPAPSGKPPAPTVVPETTPAPAKPKYDFYTELPKRQIDLQREATPAARPPLPPPPARTQPAVEPLRKPAAPKKNPTPPALLTASTSTKAGKHSESAGSPRAAQPFRSFAAKPAIASKAE